MSKKELILPFIIIGLSFAFIIVSFFVILTKGKSKKWIARKMKIGGLLLTLNTFTPGAAQEIEISCYDIAEANVFLLIENKTELIFTKSEEKIVKGIIDFRTSSDYSYRLMNNDSLIIESGEIKALDGKFNEWKEDIEFQLKAQVDIGEYFLLFYDVPVNRQNPKNYRERFNMIIKED